MRSYTYSIRDILNNMDTIILFYIELSILFLFCSCSTFNA
nr:MAG TPA: Tubulin alpha-1B chain, Tubulin beta-2B, OXYGEN TRANSPORT [Caudoviricetes sp.]